MKLVVAILKLIIKLINSFRSAIMTMVFMKAVNYFTKFIPAPIVFLLTPLKPFFSIFITTLKYLRNIQAVVGTIFFLNVLDLSVLLDPSELYKLIQTYALIVKSMFFNISEKHIPVKYPVEQHRAKIDINFPTIPPKPTEEPFFSLRDTYAHGQPRELTFWDKYGDYVIYGAIGLIVVAGVVYFGYGYGYFGGGSSNNSGSAATKIDTSGNDPTLQDGVPDASLRETFQEKLNSIANKGKGRAIDVTPPEIIQEEGIAGPSNHQTTTPDTLPVSPSNSAKVRLGLSPRSGSWRESLEEFFPLASPPADSNRHLPGSVISTPASPESPWATHPTPAEAPNLNAEVRSEAAELWKKLDKAKPGILDRPETPGLGNKLDEIWADSVVQPEDTTPIHSGDVTPRSAGSPGRDLL